MSSELDLENFLEKLLPLPSPIGQLVIYSNRKVLQVCYLAERNGSTLITSCAMLKSGKSRSGVQMPEFFGDYSSEIWSFLGGLIGGGIGGSFLTFRFDRQNRIGRDGKVVDQSRSQAGGDIVGGNKTQKPK